MVGALEKFRTLRLTDMTFPAEVRQSDQPTLVGTAAKKNLVGKLEALVETQLAA